MTVNNGGENRERLVARMIKHGAKQVEMADLMDQAQVVWYITDKDVVSETCIHAEEVMSSGARSCRAALDVMARMDCTEGGWDSDLATALRKYVQDTCEAIKQVDNALKESGSDLATLLVEIPDRSHDEVSWRELVGRRDVMAHNLLSVDDQRVRCEAERDFGSLDELLSRVYFVPVKSDFDAGRVIGPMFKGAALKRLVPAEPDSEPTIGQGLVFIYEDERQGFVAFRIGRSASNELLITGPPGVHRISLAHLKRDGS